MFQLNYVISFYDLRDLDSDSLCEQEYLITLDRKPKDCAELLISLINAWKKDAPAYYQLNSIEIRGSEWLDQPFILISVGLELTCTYPSGYNISNKGKDKLLWQLKYGMKLSTSI